MVGASLAPPFVLQRVDMVAVHIGRERRRIRRSQAWERGGDDGAEKGTVGIGER